MVKNKNLKIIPGYRKRAMEEMCMYKKYATLLLLCNMVFITAWLGVQGIIINRSVAEAFCLVDSYGERALQATSYLGVADEKKSDQRILNLQVLKREEKIQITQSEYDDLLRIVEAEAGGEDKMGKMLVANVILNRVANENFPDTISEVIFQSHNGVTQFSPISDGRFFTVKISQETVEAVNTVLEGEDNSQGALYFAARQAANPSKMHWFDTHLTRLFAYGGHEFFS